MNFVAPANRLSLYTRGVDMYFPAGIPMLAVVALVIWNTRAEMQRTQTSSPPKPKA